MTQTHGTLLTTRTTCSSAYYYLFSYIDVGVGGAGGGGRGQWGGGRAVLGGGRGPWAVGLASWAVVVGPWGSGRVGGCPPAYVVAAGSSGYTDRREEGHYPTRVGIAPAAKTTDRMKLRG